MRDPTPLSGVNRCNTRHTRVDQMPAANPSRRHNNNCEAIL